MNTPSRPGYDAVFTVTEIPKLPSYFLPSSFFVGYPEDVYRTSETLVYAQNNVLLYAVELW